MKDPLSKNCSLSFNILDRFPKNYFENVQEALITALIYICNDTSQTLSQTFCLTSILKHTFLSLMSS